MFFSLLRYPCPSFARRLPRKRPPSRIRRISYCNSHNRCASKQNSKDAGTGILEKHLDNSTILAFRDRDGKAELHQQFGDVFVVLQGTATLVTGGTIASPMTSAPGEIRGASIQEGVRKKLQEGDIAHIPAGVPHQVVLDSGGTFTYFVVKIPLK